ncbi:MAG TPA: hypothetical protein VIY48_12240 [Candidatus Paceibacterota bacterium]
MKAILLDPEVRSITEVDHDGDFRDIQRLIDAEPFDVRPLHGYPGNVIYFDDEFLLHDGIENPHTYMDIKGVVDPIGGKALILGTNGGGESISTTLTVEDVENMVSYRVMRLTGWTPMKTEKTATTTIIRGPRPIFDVDPDPGVKRDVVTIMKDQDIYRGAGGTTEQIHDFFKKGGVA